LIHRTHAGPDDAGILIVLHDWVSDNTVADVVGVSREAEWLVEEARDSLLGKVGYRTPEVFSGSVSRKAGVSYVGSCLDSLPRKVGVALPGKLCLFVLWTCWFL